MSKKSIIKTTIFILVAFAFSNFCYGKTINKIFKDENIKCQYIGDSNGTHEIIYDVYGTNILVSTDSNVRLGIITDGISKEQKMLYMSNRKSDRYDYDYSFYDLSGNILDIEIKNVPYQTELSIYNNNIVFFNGDNISFYDIKSKTTKDLDGDYGREWKFFDKYIVFDQYDIVFVDSNLNIVKKMEKYIFNKEIRVKDKNYLLLYKNTGMHFKHLNEDKNEFGKNRVNMYIVLDENLNMVYDKAMFNFRRGGYNIYYYTSEEIEDIIASAIKNKYDLSDISFTLDIKDIDNLISIIYSETCDAAFKISNKEEGKCVIVDRKGKIILELDEECKMEYISDDLKNNVYSIKQGRNIKIFKNVDGEPVTITTFDANLRYEVISTNDDWYYIMIYDYESSLSANPNEIVFYNSKVNGDTATISTKFLNVTDLYHYYESDNRRPTFKVYSLGDRKLIYYKKKLINTTNNSDDENDKEEKYEANVYSDDGTMLFFDIDLIYYEKDKNYIVITEKGMNTKVYDVNLNLVKELDYHYDDIINYNIDQIKNMRLLLRESDVSYYEDIYDNDYNLKLRGLSRNITILNHNRNCYDLNHNEHDRYIYLEDMKKKTKYKNSYTKARWFIVDSNYNIKLELDSIVKYYIVLNKGKKIYNILFFENGYKVIDENLKVVEYSNLNFYDIEKLYSKYSDNYFLRTAINEKNKKLWAENRKNLEQTLGIDNVSFMSSHKQYYILKIKSKSDDNVWKSRYALYDAEKDKMLIEDCKYLSKQKDKEYYYFNDGEYFGYIHEDGEIFIKFKA